MPITLPDGVDAFVFGSAVTSNRPPRDLDVLFIYDSDRIAPSTAYGVLHDTMAQLFEMTGLAVHPTVLTIDEELENGFRTRTEVVPLEQWLGEAHDRHCPLRSNDRCT